MGCSNVKMIGRMKDADGADVAVLRVSLRNGDCVSFPGVTVRVIGFEPGCPPRAIFGVGANRYHMGARDSLNLDLDTLYNPLR